MPIEENTHIPTEFERTSGFANSLRADLAHTEKEIRNLVDRLKSPPVFQSQNPVLAGEAIAQAMLALRHVEDARMRIGKVLQYGVQGGVAWAGKEPG